MVDNRVGTAASFWTKVRKTRTCWLWEGWANKGYGLVHRKGKDRLAHRYAWEITNGSIPAGLYVCHHCDVKNCVRPSHLFLGTQTDNMRDMWAKGRGHDTRGSKIGTSRLTESDIPIIRSMRAQKVKVRVIAAEFDVSVPTIEKIIYGSHWKHA